MCLLWTDKSLPQLSPKMRRKVNILWRTVALAAVGAVAPGCLVGPNYKRPLVEQPAAFKSLATTQSSTQPTTQYAPPISTAWWRVCPDPQLDQRIATTLDSTHNLLHSVANG